MKVVQIAYPQGLTDQQLKTREISRIAVCPGSGMHPHVTSPTTIKIIRQVVR